MRIKKYNSRMTREAINNAHLLLAEVDDCKERMRQYDEFVPELQKEVIRLRNVEKKVYAALKKLENDPTFTVQSTLLRQAIGDEDACGIKKEN